MRFASSFAGGALAALALVSAAACGSSSRSGGILFGGGGGSGGGDAVGGSEAGGQGGTVEGAPTAAVVFGEGQILEYRVTMDAANWDWLEQHGDEEVYLPADVRVTGGAIGALDLGRVGIRHKGAWTLHHCWDENGGVRSYEDECAKLSYKLKFNEYNPDTRFEGLKRINLHAASGDATKLREFLAYSIFNDFGVLAPRTAPARVYINDQFIGLFVAVEQIDGRFTDMHFPEGGDGNLYKEVWPKAGLPDERFIEALRTNEDVPDVSDMQALGAAIEATTEATFDSDLAAWVDLEAILHYVAVDRASKNWDGIMSFYSPYSPHNFYWYHDDGAEGRFHLIPWDLDNTFWEFDPFMDPQQWVTADPVPDWNVLPASCEPIPVWEPNNETRITPPGCDKFLRILASTKWDRFVEIGNDLLRGPLRYEAMDEKITRWAALIEPVVEEDPHLSAAQWRTDRDEFRATLRQAIVDFAAFLGEGYISQEPVEPLPEPTPGELVLLR